MSTSICTICLEPLLQYDSPMVATIPCGHAYHEICLKKWATERLNESEPEIFCPVCKTQVQNVMKVFLSTKSGYDDSLSGKELECWRKEYDSEAKSERLKLHANILESNKRVIDEIFEKQKILETYERDRKILEGVKAENHKLRKELFQQLLKHEAEMRRMEANKQIIQEVLERNETALTELKSTREENLDLKRELLRHIMAKQDEMRRLTASRQALTVALEHQEIALGELKKSREENLSLKKELVEHLHHHKMKMEQLQSHKEALHQIVMQHERNIKELEVVKQDNIKLKEELVQSMVMHKTDATKLAKCEGWVEVLKEEVDKLEQDRLTLKLVRTENYRLGVTVQKRHQAWLHARRDLRERVHREATTKMNFFIVVGQVGLLGFVIHSMRPSGRL